MLTRYRNGDMAIWGSVRRGFENLLCVPARWYSALFVAEREYHGALHALDQHFDISIGQREILEYFYNRP